MCLYIMVKFVPFTCLHFIAVSDKTGITASLLRHEQPLSVVFPKLLKWVVDTTEEAAKYDNNSYHPGTYKVIIIFYYQ